MKKADLIIHPVRFRIMRVLDQETLTTYEIAQKLGDIPKSSIYRHLKLLLDGQMIEVAEIRDVNGIPEKVYRLTHPPSLGPGDMATWTAEDHLRYFTTYALTLLHDFAAYTIFAEEENRVIDMVSDRVGYREVHIFATKQELDIALGKMNDGIMPLLSNKSGDGRKLYKLATVLHPYVQD